MIKYVKNIGHPESFMTPGIEVSTGPLGFLKKKRKEKQDTFCNYLIKMNN